MIYKSLGVENGKEEAMNDNKKLAYQLGCIVYQNAELWSAFTLKFSLFAGYHRPAQAR